jgi:hypothetical protein
MSFLGKKEVRFDEDKTTAADYTIIIHNPPPEAVDPDDWRVRSSFAIVLARLLLWFHCTHLSSSLFLHCLQDFFDQFSDKAVTLCTVALNNEQLLAKLVQRRKDIKSLKRQLPAPLFGRGAGSVGVKCGFDNDEQLSAVDDAVKQAKRYRESLPTNCLSKLVGLTVTPLLRRLGLCLTEEMLWKRIQATTEDIKTLQKLEYQAAAVYVTFETEQGQRTALEALNASEMEVITKSAINLDPSALFQGTVLRVNEASEPNAVVSW